MTTWNLRGPQNSIREALQIELPDHAVISFVGAGGKTSLMCALARELASDDLKVVMTTTTHMMHPEFAETPYPGKAIIYYPNHPSYASAPDAATLSEDCSQINELLDQERIVMIASSDPSNARKVCAPPKELLEYACKTADAVLIEADGSRRLPLKWPKAHEPVVPENTDLSICVAGLTSLGRPIADILYGTQEMPQALMRTEVDETLIAAIVSSPDGGLKDTYGDYRVFLNQADSEELQEKAAYIQKLLAVRGIQSAWGTLKNDIY